MQTLIAVAMAGFPLVAVEAFSRLTPLNPELTRKLTHILSAYAVVMVAELFGHKQLLSVSAIFLVVMLLGRRLNFWRSIYGVRRETWGEIAFVVGVGLAASLTMNKTHFVYGIMALGLADMMAWLIGFYFGKTKLLGGPKTLEGTAAGFLTATAIGAILFSMELSDINIILLAVVVSVSEFIVKNGLDNITIPVASVLALGVLA